MKLVDLPLQVGRASSRIGQRDDAAAARRAPARHQKREAPVAGDQPERLGPASALRAGSSGGARRRVSTTPRFDERMNSTTWPTSPLCGPSTSRRRSASDSGSGSGRARGTPSAAPRARQQRRRAGAAPRVDAEDPRTVADRQREGQHVLGRDRVAAHEGVRPDAAELVHTREGTDRREVVHLDVARERGRVREDRVADPTAQSCATWTWAMKRLSEPMLVTPPPPAVPRWIVANSRKMLRSPTDAASLAVELEVLRHQPDRGVREDVVALTIRRVAIDRHVGVEHGARAETHAGADDA